jgi:lipopolysaccharide/colanic/teichoic acid biosynthesis glycosyltransferase
MYKFRTMRTSRELDIEFHNITRLGLFLRSHSIDELPQLINVLIGNMSLVGPRPLLMSYLPLYSAKQMVRHHVKPGMTGLAQVSGRNSLDWDTKFDFDMKYVESFSFKTDVKIIFKTFKVIFDRKHVSVSDSIIVKPFSRSSTTYPC